MIQALLARGRQFATAPGAAGALLGVLATVAGSYLLHQYIGQQTEELHEAYTGLRKLQATVVATERATYPAADDLDPLQHAQAPRPAAIDLVDAQGAEPATPDGAQ